LASNRRPDYEKVINGRLVQAWKRRSSVDVLVFPEADPEDEPVGDWEMPVIIDWTSIALTAEKQTPRSKENGS
jgi:hypothetical protein